MSNAAPVCAIQPVISTEQPQAPTLPNIPTATDLPSALRAINAMGMWMRQAQSRLNPPPPQPQGKYLGLKKTDNSTRNPNNNRDSSGQGRWTRVSQQYENVKVYNPDDHTQWVEVKQIVGLTMTDNKTGEKWIWNR